MLNKSEVDFSHGKSCYENGHKWYRQSEYERAIDCFIDAISFFKKVIPADKNYMESREYLVVCYNNIGFYYKHMKGNNYCKQGNFVQAAEEWRVAISYYEKAISIDIDKDVNSIIRDLATCYFNIGIYYQNNKNYIEAIKHHEKAVSLDKNTPGAIENLRICYNHLDI